MEELKEAESLKADNEMASSGCGDTETEDAQGVEGQVSAKQSPIYPPEHTTLKCRKHKGESKCSRTIYI